MLGTSKVSCCRYVCKQLANTSFCAQLVFNTHHIKSSACTYLENKDNSLISNTIYYRLVITSTWNVLLRDL